MPSGTNSRNIKCKMWVLLGAHQHCTDCTSLDLSYTLYKCIERNIPVAFRKYLYRYICISKYTDVYYRWMSIISDNIFFLLLKGFSSFQGATATLNLGKDSALNFWQLFGGVVEYESCKNCGRCFFSITKI